MTLEREYETAAREMLLEHLGGISGKARIRHDGVHTGIGRIAVEVTIKSIEPEAGAVQLVFWATVDGVAGLVPASFALDLLGHGADAHAALADGIHALVDGVIPVLRHDHDRGTVPDGVAVAPMISMVGGRAASWDLILGVPSIGGEPRASMLQAIDDLVLLQGIIDSLTPALGEVRPHWVKLFLIRSGTGELAGDVKVDGESIGVVSSFDGPGWPEGQYAVRQFGLARPSRRKPEPELIEPLRDAGRPADSSERRWWRRLGR